MKLIIKKDKLILYIESDGAAVNTRIEDENGSTWKENKLAIFFNDRDMYNRKGKANMITHKEFVSYLGNVDTFRTLLFAKAVELKYWEYENIIFISDGATWLRNMISELFPEAIQILDKFHLIENIFLKDNNYDIIDYNEDNKINIYMKSRITSCKCPKCGFESNKHHSTYRKLQDTPIHNTETWLNIIAYEFECTNEMCKVTTFAEELPFARKNKVKTDALIQFILSISIFLSSTAASLILSFLGVKVSADSIDDIVKNIKIVDEPYVEAVGIDDVAIRKGQKYSTAIYDLKDHHLLALIEGRDAESIKDFSTNHKKIKIIARDRASSYAKAISKILPNCIQVADRFHLFENLIKYLKEIFYNELPDKIFIKDNEIKEAKEINKVKIEFDIDEFELNKLDYDNTPPLDSNGQVIIFDNKRHDLNSKQYEKQTRNRIEKMKMIKRLRERLKTSNCHDIKVIAKEFNISQNSLRKYKKMTDEEVENLVKRKDYKKRKTVMDDYINIIYKMIKDNIPSEYIIEYVTRKGYKGKIRNIDMYIIS